MDELLLNETQKGSAARGAPKHLDSDFNENYLYQVEETSLEENEEKLEWHKRAFECKLKNSSGIEKWNYLIHIHEKEVNKTAKWNLLHDIINPTEYIKI